MNPQRHKAQGTRQEGETCHRPFCLLPSAFCLSQRGFSSADLLAILAVVAVLAAIVLPILANQRATAHRKLCAANLQQVTRAILMYATDQHDTLPLLPTNAPPPQVTWWFYKEKVKSYAGLSGPSSPRDRVFACPDDRGYDEEPHFFMSKKADFTSYTFNGVNLPGMPNIAGRTVSSIKTPAKTLLVMDWSAHLPVSWHESKTGRKNHPFYNDAENMVGFVDGSVKFIPIYYDGFNAAYTRDPIPGYDYKYSGD
jgi:type II secretory pathway pseudopilin PulG